MFKIAKIAKRVNTSCEKITLVVRKYSYRKKEITYENNTKQYGS